MIEHLKIDNFKPFNDCEVTFKTSLEVIQKVMNVPMCAVKSLLRSNGYNNINDETSLCIDEERLGIFSEAYIRKMKNYFTRSLQNIASLPPKERSDYNKFVELFKKQDSQKREPKNWNDIDTDRLKEAFIEKVKKETSVECPRYSFILSDELARRIFINRFSKIIPEKEVEVKYINISDYAYKLILNNLGMGFSEQEILEKRLEEEEYVLANIINSEYYIAEPIQIKLVWYIINLIVKIIIYAKYHIYSMKDDEDSNNVNLNFMRNVNFNFNNKEFAIWKTNIIAIN